MKGAPLTPTAGVHASGTGDPRRPNYSMFPVRYIPRRLGESETYDEEVNDLDRIFRDHKLLSGLQAPALRAVHATVLERRLRPQECRRALQRLPALISTKGLARLDSAIEAGREGRTVVFMNAKNLLSTVFWRVTLTVYILSEPAHVSGVVPRRKRGGGRGNVPGSRRWLVNYGGYEQ